MLGKTLVCNPGAVCGNVESPSYAVYDTSTRDVQFVEL